MLLDAHLREVSFAGGRLVYEDFRVGECLFAELGELLGGICLGESFKEVGVLFATVVVAAAVTPVMADIERLVAGGSLRIFNICRFRVH